MSDLSDEELRARLAHAMGEGPAFECFVEPLRELQRHRAAMKRIERLREQWRPHAEREWLGQAFIDDLDEAIKGTP